MPARFPPRLGRSRALVGFQAVLAEQVAQPTTKRLEFRAQPVNCHLGVSQFLRGLLAGREEQDQGCNKSVVAGDVDSFLGA